MSDDGMNPGERALRARIGAYAMHGRNDARETTAKARAAFLDRFEHGADVERLIEGGLDADLDVVEIDEHCDLESLFY